ncbi:MAG TPA: hypothetical protein GXX37_04050 [Clostridiaceae bacterium]|nr:hypothetical protein [Clostridiaceae bacterium]
MYKEYVGLVFNEIDSQPEPVLFETDMCGGNSRLMIFDEEKSCDKGSYDEGLYNEDSYDESDFYSKLRYISRKYASSVPSFLNNVLSEEVYLLCLIKILLNKDDDLFCKFTRG